MKLAAYLELAGISQEAFAAKIGRAPSSVSRILRGSQKPDFATMAAIERETDGAVRFADFAADQSAAQ